MQLGLVPLALGAAAVIAGLLGWPSSAIGQEADEPTRPGRHYALIIGVAGYSPTQFPALPQADADATDLAAVLRQAGYIVTLMTQSRAADDPSLGALAPMHDFIEDQLELLLAAEDLTEQDTVIVALAGHGLKLIEEVDGQEVPHFYFCPADARKRVGGGNEGESLFRLADLTERNRLISVASIYRRLADCKAGQKLLLADICRRVPGSRSSSVTMPRMAPPPGGVAVFYSCSEDQEAFESKQLGHGVFFHHVIEGLKGEADAGSRSRPADGIVTLSELQAYVAPSVMDYMRANPGEFGGEIQRPELKNETRGELRLLELPGLPVGERPGKLREFTSLPEFRMAWIPAGRFTMGSPVPEAGRFANEDQVEVEMTQGFWLGETEVTQAQWRSLMGSEPWKGKEYVREGDRHPATYVSWEDAVEFCRRLTDQERRAGRLSSRSEYRLPTEAEWEYACRAGSRTAYGFGDDASRLGDYGWFDENALDRNEKYAHAVGQKRPNAWNLRDMHGNCFEWCLDWYADDLPGGVDPVGPSEGHYRVFRGGCWFGSAVHCRSSYRYRFDVSFSNHVLGFRVAAVPVRE